MNVKHRVIAALSAVALLTACSSGSQTPPPLPTTAEGADALRRDFTTQLLGRPDAGQESPIQESAFDRLSLPEIVQPEVRSVKMLTVPLRFGLVSRVLVMYPEGAPKKCAVVYSAGHSGQWDVGGDQAVLVGLRKGCTVAALEMPGYGRNGGQIAKTADGHTVDLTSTSLHERYWMLDEASASALDIFVDPVLQTVRYLQRTEPGVPVVLTGLSGGGYTSMLAAAVDTSVSQTISVAGSGRPTGPEACTEDYEYCATLQRGATLEQAYYLAAQGPFRRFTQVSIWNDDCCYRQIRAEEYAEDIAAAVEATGLGQFLFLSDTFATQHSYTLQALQVLEETITLVTNAAG